MKRNIIALISLIITMSVNAQIVVNSQFKARSFSDLAAPLIMASRFADECLEKLDALAEETEKIEVYLNKEKDRVAWKRYADCYNSIIDEYNRIANYGTNRETRNKISSLSQNSRSLQSTIITAFNRRNSLAQDQYTRLRSVDGLMCDKFYSEMSLDEFLDGKTPNVNYRQNTNK